MAKNLGIYRCAACGYTLKVVELGQKNSPVAKLPMRGLASLPMPLSLAATNPWSYWNQTQ